jgi:hypothetical protein
MKPRFEGENCPTLIGALKRQELVGKGCPPFNAQYPI